MAKSIQACIETIQQYWKTHNLTADDILRMRIQEYSERYQEYQAFCKHKFGSASVDDELGLIRFVDDGGDAVTTTTRSRGGRRSAEAHMTATTRVRLLLLL